MEPHAPTCPECRAIKGKITQLKANSISPSYTKLNETISEIENLILKTPIVDRPPDFYSLDDRILICTTFKLRTNNLGRVETKIGVAFGETNPSNRIVKVEPVLTSDRISAAILAASLPLTTAQEIGILAPW